MRNVTVAAIQMSMTGSVNENIEKSLKFAKEAVSKGANIILPSELFERPYFCQERRYEYYDFATSVDENPAIKAYTKFAAENKVVVIVSFYEKAGLVLYNSVVVIDADGKNLGTYRKTHIPDDHFYQEKFYFTPGDTGFRTFKTMYGTIGVGICWDQWFPETARGLALNGAELIFYPTAIGSEPILECDSSGHWRRCMQGHSASNIVPVIAANRVGTESVEPCEANNNQTSSLTFYGSSFITDDTGEVVAELNKTEEGVITASFDLDKVYEDRMGWGLFRDRRPEIYNIK